MRTVNRVTLLGHVGQDPTIRRTAKGGVVANLTLATHHKREDEKDLTEWHRLVAFGRTAEIVRDYLVKGFPLYVEGQLHTREWEQDGQKRSATEVVISDLSLPGNKAANKSKSAALKGCTSDTQTNESVDFDACIQGEL